MELNDIYDQNRRLTGKVHRRGTRWRPGEFGLVVCVWVYNTAGQLLLTRRAPEKSYPGTWENSGGAAQSGEDSLQAIVRELFEETGIQAEPEEFRLIGTDRDEHTHFDFYCIQKDVPLEKIVLQPGETDDAMWVSFSEVHNMIREKKICRIIARQFLRQEPLIMKLQQTAV